jgi:hypothetical protein
MVLRRRAIALSALAAVAFSVTVAAQNQQKPPATPQPRKLSDAERRELEASAKVADALMASQPGPNDLGLAWVRNDVLKADGNKQYIPFTIAIDPTKVSGDRVTVFYRVESMTDRPADPATQKSGEKPKVPQYAWEDINSAAMPSDRNTPLRISRSFAALPGTYRVHVVIKEPTPQRAPRNAPPPKVAALSQTLEIPDFWNGELSTSSVFVGRLDPLPAPLTPQQQVERPYAIGGMEITPDPSTKYTKKGELSTFMLIYNPKTDPANKPDIVVEYNFYAKQGDAEKFFNKTNPQNLNAQTLPPQFDFAAGHQLQAGQAVPLASFPEGDYRLEIKVTDKLANKTLTRDVTFSVAGS